MSLHILSNLSPINLIRSFWKQSFNLNSIIYWFIFWQCTPKQILIKVLTAMIIMPPYRNILLYGIESFIWGEEEVVVCLQWCEEMRWLFETTIPSHNITDDKQPPLSSHHWRQTTNPSPNITEDKHPPLSWHHWRQTTAVCLQWC
jgi:hypothetical protein